LQWTEPSTFETVGDRVTNYTLLKDAGSGVFYEHAVISGSTREYIDTDLVPGADHNYQVFASNVIGSGTASSVCIGTAGQEPGKVPFLIATLNSSTSLTFSWVVQSIPPGGLPITGYVVSKDDGDYVFDTVSITPPTETNGLAAYTYSVPAGNSFIGLTYRFRLAAVNQLGTGVLSDELQLVATNPPGTPTVTLDETSRTLDGFKLNFGRPSSDGGSPHIGFLLYRDEGIAGSPFTLAFNGSSMPQIAEYTISGLQTALTYQFQVYALNKIFQSNTPATIKPWAQVYR
jgi:hypothetical protein